MADHPPHDAAASAREDGPEGGDEPDDGLAAPARPDATGVPGVDAVVNDLARLDDRALDEHPAVFEHAHAELRRALDEPPGPA